MKTFLITLILAISYLTLSAQPGGLSLKKKKTNKGDVYALIIGISDYRDENIDDLSFAHRDAQEFANFLLSPAGGNVNPDNIKLILNEDATISNIYSEKKDIEKKVGKNDRFYFYFAGHGDVESSIYKLGFLIAHDTPDGAYLNNAVRIEDINIMANTLSVEKGAEVVLITDACHSGKLAGSDNRGKQLIGEQLSTVQKKEIRIASCEADELAEEDSAWGGGRGAFSYYLIKGLKGLADTKKVNGIVTLEELKRYLEDNVSLAVEEIKDEEQNPVIEGKNKMKMAIVDRNTLATLNTDDQSTTASGDGVSRSMGRSQKLKLVRELNQQKLVDRIDFGSLADLDDYELWEALQINIEELRDNKLSDKRKKEAVVTAIHNEIQEIVNDYLAGSEAELQRRQYNSTDKEVYLRYIDMMSIAIKLSDPSSPLNHILRVKYHYFNGLNARLKLLFSKTFDSDYAFAYDQQQKAYALDPLAPYVVNEIGVLKTYNKEKDANVYYQKAIDLAPKWAIPHSNLANYFRRNGDTEKSLALAKKSLHLHPGYFAGLLGLGKAYFNQGNYLFAEEYFQKAAKANNQHYGPYEQLGHTFTQIGLYEDAELNFIEAEIRKKGYEFFSPLLVDEDADGIVDLFDIENSKPPIPCDLKEDLFGEKDVFAYFAKGLEFYYDKKYDNAIPYFKKALANNIDDPITYKYLGDCYYHLKKYTEAQKFYESALNNYVSKVEFDQITRKIRAKQKYLDCKVEEIYKVSYFDKVKLQYLQADVYTQMKYYFHAEEIYVLPELADRFETYYLLWNLYEEQRRFKEAEDKINVLAELKPELFLAELYGFYDRRVLADDAPGYYRYKRGLLCYEQRAKTRDQEPIVQIKDIRENFVPGTGRSILYSNLPQSFSDIALEDFTFVENHEDSDSILIAESCYRLGNIYQWDGDAETSKNYYRKAIDHDANNSSSAAIYIDKADFFYDYEAALGVMDYLAAKDRLNYDLTHLYVAYNLKARRTDISRKYLAQLKEMNIREDSTYIAVELYNAIFDDDLESAYEIADKMEGKGIIPDNELYYTQARMYAMDDNKAACYTYLKKALDAGFNYPWVLEREIVFNIYREDSEFQLLSDRLPAKLDE